MRDFNLESTIYPALEPLNISERESSANLVVFNARENELEQKYPDLFNLVETGIKDERTKGLFQSLQSIYPQETDILKKILLIQAERFFSSSGFAAGINITDLAKKIGIEPYTVSRHLSSMGIETARGKVSKEERDTSAIRGIEILKNSNERISIERLKNELGIRKNFAETIIQRYAWYLINKSAHQYTFEDMNSNYDVGNHILHSFFWDKIKFILTTSTQLPTLRELSNMFGIKHTLIGEFVLANGLKVRHGYESIRERNEEILKLVDAKRLSIKEIASQVGRSPRRVNDITKARMTEEGKRDLNSMSARIGKGYGPDFEKQIEQIYSEPGTYKPHIAELCRMLNVSEDYVRGLFSRLGIEAPDGRRPKLLEPEKQKEMDEWVIRFILGETTREIINTSSSSRFLIQAYLEKNVPANIRIKNGNVARSISRGRSSGDHNFLVEFKRFTGEKFSLAELEVIFGLSQDTLKQIFINSNVHYSLSNDSSINFSNSILEDIKRFSFLNDYSAQSSGWKIFSMRALESGNENLIRIFFALAPESNNVDPDIDHVKNSLFVWIKTQEDLYKSAFTQYSNRNYKEELKTLQQIYETYGENDFISVFIAGAQYRNGNYEAAIFILKDILEVSIKKLGLNESIIQSLYKNFEFELVNNPYYKSTISSKAKEGSLILKYHRLLYALSELLSFD